MFGRPPLRISGQTLCLHGALCYDAQRGSIAPPPGWPQFGRYRDTFRRKRPEFGRHRAKSGGLRASFSRPRSMFVQQWPSRSKLGLLEQELGMCTELGQTWPAADRSGTAKVGPTHGSCSKGAPHQTPDTGLGMARQWWRPERMSKLGQNSTTAWQYSIDVGQLRPGITGIRPAPSRRRALGLTLSQTDSPRIRGAGLVQSRRPRLGIARRRQRRPIVP